MKLGSIDALLHFKVILFLHDLAIMYCCNCCFIGLEQYVSQTVTFEVWGRMHIILRNKEVKNFCLPFSGLGFNFHLLPRAETF